MKTEISTNSKIISEPVESVKAIIEVLKKTNSKIIVRFVRDFDNINSDHDFEIDSYTPNKVVFTDGEFEKSMLIDGKFLGFRYIQSEFLSYTRKIRFKINFDPIHVQRKLRNYIDGSENIDVDFKYRQDFIKFGAFEDSIKVETGKDFIFYKTSRNDLSNYPLKLAVERNQIGSGNVRIERGEIELVGDEREQMIQTINSFVYESISGFISRIKQSSEIIDETVQTH